MEQLQEMREKQQLRAEAAKSSEREAAFSASEREAAEREAEEDKKAPSSEQQLSSVDSHSTDPADAVKVDAGIVGNEVEGTQDEHEMGDKSASGQGPTGAGGENTGSSGQAQGSTKDTTRTVDDAMANVL